MTRVLTIILAAVMTMALPVAAYAHKVNIFAYAEDGTLHSQSYFADGGPAEGAKVTATGGPSGDVLAEGVTDAEGAFSFGIKGAGPITVMLNAGQGHGNEYTLSAEEVAEATGGVISAPKAEPGKPAAAVSEKEPVPETAGAPVAAVSADEDTIRRIVREELDRKLTPVNRQLLDIKEEFEKPSIAETISGIGYIFGILGIILYLRSKKR